MIFGPDVYEPFGSAARHPGYHFHRHLLVKPWHKVTVRLYITQTRLFLSNDIPLNAAPSAIPLSVLIRVLNNLSAERNHWEKTHTHTHKKTVAEWWIMYQRTKASIKANVLCFWTGKQQRCQVTGRDLRALEMNYDSDLEVSNAHLHSPHGWRLPKELSSNLGVTLI